MAKTKPKVLIAEHHNLVRVGTKSLLDADGAVKVIAEAEDGQTTLQLVASEQPDILIIGLSMPKLSGMAVITQLKKQKNPIKIVVLTAVDAPHVWKEVVDLGVEGIALKTISKTELIAGIKAVVAGKPFIHSEIQPGLDALIAEESQALAEAEDSEAAPKRRRKISKREKQVIKLVAEGYKTKDIGEILGISDRTVSKHRENIMTKLEMSASAELVNYASYIGLLKVGLDEIR